MKLFSKLTFASAVVALAFVSLASAQSMRVSVPFDFRASGQSLPAGLYAIELTQRNHVVTIRQLDGKAACFLLVQSYIGPGAPDHGSAVFDRYGDRYFLSRVNAPGVPRGAAMPVDRAALELAKAAKPSTQVVVASADH